MIDDDALAAPEPQPSAGTSPMRKAVIAVAVAGAMVLGGFGLSVAWAQTSPTAPPPTDGGTAPEWHHGHCHGHDGDSGGTVAPDTAPERTPNPST
jgi:hypothetical protein